MVDGARLSIKRRQRVRKLYEQIKQFRTELSVATDQTWGDVEDELTQAMSHLNIADRMLSGYDEE